MASGFLKGWFVVASGFCELVVRIKIVSTFLPIYYTILIGFDDTEYSACTTYIRDVRAQRGNALVL